MPSQPMKIFFQIQLCKATSEPIQYTLSNAFTGETLHRGKIYFKDPYGSHYISTLTFLENQIKLTGENSNLFIKHVGIKDNYELNIKNDYSVSFDQNNSAIIITKPILGEPFNFTVIIHKLSLEKITTCDLAFSDNITNIGDYVKTFTSISSDIITHYIDFNSIGYNQGTKIWILIYALQLDNTKIVFKYPVITGEVGNVSRVIKIDQIIEEQPEYMTVNFKVKSSSNNYLYYDFQSNPIGNVSSIRIKTEKARVSKVGCIFISNEATEEQMISEVNKAFIEDTNCCIGENNAAKNTFNALINAKFSNGNNRLVIQIVYDLDEEKENSEDIDANIVIKNGGTNLSDQGQYQSQEPYTAIPYVIDLLKIRDDKDSDIVSKILFYSNTRELQLFYLAEDKTKPVSLINGNIIVLYTNEELIKQKYHGVTTLILLTDTLSDMEKSILGEQYKFIVYFFNSDINIQYFMSSNAEGRPLNSPIIIEMTSCAQPYYYIMNYNKIEGQRKLHIDTIFGEKNSIKLATNLNEGSWDKLLENLDTIGNEVILEQGRFHIDILEVTCNVPLLINLFYVNPSDIKITNLEKGDISIFSLVRGEEQVLTFSLGQEGPFLYSFTIEKDSVMKPNIIITFDDIDSMNITSNGVYTKKCLTQYNRILVKNNENSGNINTRIIFKFGYEIETTFVKDENDIYMNKNDKNRDYNLYGYIYDQSDYSILNYTGVDFNITTDEDNIKFCYNTNLGTYLYPSLENCFNVGKNNPYIINTLNLFVMFRNYTSDEHMNYYVGFRTVNVDQNIKIYPVAKKYDTKERNLEGIKNKLKISSEIGEISTILTAPKNHEKYILLETCLCTKKSNISYQFKNAYNSSIIGNESLIQDSYVKIDVIENTLFDTELKFYNGKIEDEIFVKHIGYNSRSLLSPRKIIIDYNNDTKILNWTQPLINENIKYTIYIDNINVIKKMNYTLCSLIGVTNLPHYSINLTTNSETPNITINFTAPELEPSFEEFDVIIVAEQLQNQKLILMSITYDSLGYSDEDPAPGEPESDEDKGEGNTDKNTDQPTDKPSESDETLKIVLSICIPIAIIIIALALVFILRLKRKKSSLTQSQIENIISKEQLV